MKLSDQELLCELSFLNNILSLGLDKELKSIKQRFKLLLQDNFKEIIPVKDIEGLSEKLEESFFSSRMPSAILQYGISLRQHHTQTAT